MRSRVVASVVTVMIAAVLSATESAAQNRDRDKDDDRGGPKPKSDAVLLLPITGSTSTGGTFDGKFALQRFASDRTGAIVAVGMISGTVRNAAGVSVGTVLKGPVSLPVDDPRPGRRTGSAPAPSGTVPASAPSGPGPSSEDETPAPAPVIAPAQACDVLSLAIGAVDFNVLGVVVHTDPIALEISGDTGGPLGAVVCLVLNAVGSIVGLLNTILGLLGGLTGGLGL